MHNETSARGLAVAFIIVALTIIIGVAVLFVTQPAPVQIVVNPPMPTVTPQPSATPGPITVYVTGAVANPGVMVELSAGSRVQDAVDAAGGLAANADPDRVNLAGLLRDGDQIHVFPLETAEEETLLPTPGGGDQINVNTATAEELDTLPGIGPVTAANIIAYREANGPFSALEDLLDVPGIGPAAVAELEGRVRFD